MLQQGGDQQAADAAIAIQEGVDGLELHMHQRDPHQRGQCWRRVMDEPFQVRQQGRRLVGRRRHGLAVRRRSSSATAAVRRAACGAHRVKADLNWPGRMRKHSLI
jgi:hypothetical protein